MLALLVAGCATSVGRRHYGDGQIQALPQPASAYYGRGRLPPLGRDVLVEFVQYFSAKDPNRAFAMSTDGQKAGISSCPPVAVLTHSCGQLEDLALLACLSVSRGQPCVVVAVGDEIVWRDQSDVTPPVSAFIYNNNGPGLPAAAPR